MAKSFGIVEAGSAPVSFALACSRLAKSCFAIENIENSFGAAALSASSFFFLFGAKSLKNGCGGLGEEMA